MFYSCQDHLHLSIDNDFSRLLSGHPNHAFKRAVCVWRKLINIYQAAVVNVVDQQLGDFGKVDVLKRRKRGCKKYCHAVPAIFACLLTVVLWHGWKRGCHRADLLFFCRMGVSCHLSPSCWAFFIKLLWRKEYFSLIVLITFKYVPEMGEGGQWRSRNHFSSNEFGFRLSASLSAACCLSLPVSTLSLQVLTTQLQLLSVLTWSMCVCVSCQHFHTMCHKDISQHDHWTTQQNRLEVTRSCPTPDFSSYYTVLDWPESRLRDLNRAGRVLFLTCFGLFCLGSAPVLPLL